jgi:hypothetical protein
MLATSTVDSSFTELSPSPIKATDDSTQQIGGTSLLMHSSFGVHRHHSDDVASSSFTTTTTFRPRRSISSSAGQQQTHHIVCMLNNYSHSLPPTNQQQTTSDDDEHEQQIKDLNHNLTQEQREDSFNDDDEDITNELNLAVVVGNEDAQSLKGFSTEQTNNENGSLDVAFIDETDFERNLSNNKPICENHDVIDVQTLNIENNENETLTQTIVAERNEEQRNTIEIKDNNNQELIQSSVPVLVEKPLNKDDDLDEILRRNENRCIRLTDSDAS